MSHYDNTRNRFNPENRFIGDIEDGKRYPFACYTKEESDNKYAAKSTETDLTELTATVASKADESECVDIRERLDSLEYQPIEITLLNVSPDVIEMGSANTITCTWGINKTPTSQNLNGAAISGNVAQFTGVSTAQTYTLSVFDEQTTDTATVNVALANRIYYGAAVNLTAVTSLSSVLSNNKERKITITAGSGEYIIYAIPKRLGNVTFFVNSLEGGFEETEEQTLINENNFAELYKVYKSVNPSLGTTVIDVRGV